MTPGAEFQLRPAVLSDQRGIANLIHFSPNIHRHLDWRNPVDWIGSPPFFVIEIKDQIVAALGCPPDPPAVAWLRLFVNSGVITLHDSWKFLWEKASTELIGKGPLVVAAIALHDWLSKLLLSSGFGTNQSIVMLERDAAPLEKANLPDGITIRAMQRYDLPQVAKLDASAFEHLWQNSLSDLERAFPQSLLATVAEMDGKPIGYQISTRNPIGVHLARLAVHPALQGHGVGYSLLADLILKAGQRGLSHLTVNTQSDNPASLALYKRMGFHETGDRYAVFQINIQ
jgi:[ribosomal protein S18]-alanine N-acetyltransferase